MNELDKDNHSYSYNEFHKRFERIYGNSQQVDRWLDQVHNIKRNQYNTLSDYIDEFTELSTKLDSFRHQKDLINLFRGGLDDKVAQEMMLREPTDLEQTIRLAIKIEKSLGYNSNPINYVSKEVNKSNYNKYNNYNNKRTNNNGTRSNNNRNNDSNRNNGNAKDNYESGYKTNNYKNYKSYNNQNNNNKTNSYKPMNNNYSNNNNNTRQCYNCGQRLHIKRFCTNNKVYVISNDTKNEKTNVLLVMKNPASIRTMALIDKTEIPVFFDTGAQVSNT